MENQTENIVVNRFQVKLTLFLIIGILTEVLLILVFETDTVQAISEGKSILFSAAAMIYLFKILLPRNAVWRILLAMITLTFLIILTSLETIVITLGFTRPTMFILFYAILVFFGLLDLKHTIFQFKKINIRSKQAIN